MKKLYLLTCVLGSIALVSCGGDSGGSVSDNNADIQGKWVLDCVSDAEAGSSRIEYTFAGNSLHQALVFYVGTTECNNEVTFTVALDTTIRIDGSTTTTADGIVAKNIDLFFTPGNFRASELMLEEIESQGTTLEAIAAARGHNDINNIPLSYFEIDSSERYSIYSVDGNQLRIGLSQGGLIGNSPDLRTNIFNSNVFTRL